MDKFDERENTLFTQKSHKFEEDKGMFQEKDWKKSTREAFSILDLQGFQFFLMENRNLGAELEATLCGGGKTKARAKVSCKCISDKLLRVEIQLSEEGKRTRDLEVILKDDCNCRQFQVLERRKDRVIMSRSGLFP